MKTVKPAPSLIFFTVHNLLSVSWGFKNPKQMIFISRLQDLTTGLNRKLTFKNEYLFDCYKADDFFSLYSQSTILCN